MAKHIRIRMTDKETQQVCYWTAWHEPVLRGWMFKDHEGYSRFQDGNWMALVARVRGTADNYGLTSNIS